MKTEHTPGPWNISKIGNPYNQYAIYSDSPKDNVLVANSIEGLANAELIAAAPEMAKELAALREQLSSKNVASFGAFNSFNKLKAERDRLREALKLTTVSLQELLPLASEESASLGESARHNLDEDIKELEKEADEAIDRAHEAITTGESALNNQI